MQSLEGYLNDLASEKPTPGGGSAAILVAAFAAALVAMVARICAGNPKYASQGALARALIAQADGLREELLAARPLDEGAFRAVLAAGALPKASEEQRAVRSAALERALDAAALEPLSAAQKALAVLRAAQKLLAIPNRSLRSDIGCAAEFAHAAVAACAHNVRINHAYMNDAHRVATQGRELAAVEAESASLHEAIRSALG